MNFRNKNIKKLKLIQKKNLNKKIWFLIFQIKKKKIRKYFLKIIKKIEIKIKYSFIFS